MTIYTIYKSCNQFIPPIERWFDTTNRTIPSDRCSKIPYEALEEQNNEAVCKIKRSLNEPLKIKYASLNIGTTSISLTLEVEEESFQMIRNARTELAKIYNHTDRSMEPIDKKLHIQLAYGIRKNVNIQSLNRLNMLVRPFNGAKLALPSVYLDNGNQFIEFKRKTDCSVWDAQDL